MTPTIRYHCPECIALVNEMHSAVDEADFIIRRAGVLIHASKPSRHVDEWRQISGQWDNAQRKWLVAAANLKNHIATTPGHVRVSEERGRV